VFPTSASRIAGIRSVVSRDLTTYAEAPAANAAATKARSAWTDRNTIFGSALGILEPFRGLQSIQHRHGNVGDEYVGVQGQNRSDGLIAILRCADNLKLLAERSANPRDYGLVIIGKHDSNLGHETPQTVPTF
jgi:hypothetical protein